MTRPLERLPTYLSHRGSSPNIVRKKVLKNEILKNLLFWNEVSFLGDCNWAFEKAIYVLSHRGSGPNIIRKKSFEKWNFEKSSFFEMKFLFWVIVTGPLKRLLMYLSHRGSCPNIVQKKFWKIFLFEMKFLFGWLWSGLWKGCLRTSLIEDQVQM